MNSDGELEVSIGDVVDVTLDLVEDGYGETILSREKAKRKKVWSTLETYLNNQEIVSGKVWKGKRWIHSRVDGCKSFFTRIISRC